MGWIYGNALYLFTLHTTHLHTIVNEVLIELWDHVFRRPVPKETRPVEVVQLITTEMAEAQPPIEAAVFVFRSWRVRNTCTGFQLCD